MNLKKLYLLAGLLLLAARFYLNFHYELLPGTNGGYYPVQVRSLLENGRLGFSDMPLYFYLNAALVKIAGWLTGMDMEALILFVNKAVDSLTLPLMVWPLYLIRKRVINDQLPVYFETVLIAFAVLSFGPLMLTSELQKNGAAMPLLTFFLYSLLVFYQDRTWRALALALLFFVLTGLTHFGVFGVALATVLIGIFVLYGRGAVIPALGIALAAVGLVFLFDATRALRLLQSARVIFERPAILSGGVSPFTIFYMLVFYPIVFIGVRAIRRRAWPGQDSGKDLFLVCAGLLVALTLPIIDGQYAMRFNLMAFVPAYGVLLTGAGRLTPFWERTVSAVLIMTVAASLFTLVGHPRAPSITPEAFRDLEKLGERIEDPGNTLILARHGLEWWVAWRVKSKVGQEKAVEESTFSKYGRVISLAQKDAAQYPQPGPAQPFADPYNPEERAPVYESTFFRAVELNAGDLEAIRASVERARPPGPGGRSPRKPPE